MINSDIKKVLIELNQRIINGIDNTCLIELVREYSIKLGIGFVTLYNLLLNKEYLIQEIDKEVNIIDIKLERLNKEIEDLVECKKELCSVVCDMYGHEFIDSDNDVQICKYCGKQKHISNSKKLFKWHKR